MALEVAFHLVGPARFLLETARILPRQQVTPRYTNLAPRLVVDRWVNGSTNAADFSPATSSSKRLRRQRVSL
jgi:hypothetical protein